MTRGQWTDTSGPAILLSPHQSCETNSQEAKKGCQRRSYILKVSQLLNGQTRTHTKLPSYFLSLFLALFSTCLTPHTNLLRYLLCASPTGMQSHKHFCCLTQYFPPPQHPAQGCQRAVLSESLWVHKALTHGPEPQRPLPGADCRLVLWV